MGLQIVGLARFGVGMEEEVNAVFLWSLVSMEICRGENLVYLSSNGHAAGYELSSTVLSGHHTELGGIDKLVQVLNLLLDRGLILVLLGIGVGWLAASVCVGERHNYF